MSLFLRSSICRSHWNLFYIIIWSYDKHAVHRLGSVLWLRPVIQDAGRLHQDLHIIKSLYCPWHSNLDKLSSSCNGNNGFVSNPCPRMSTADPEWTPCILHEATNISLSSMLEAQEPDHNHFLGPTASQTRLGYSQYYEKKRNDPHRNILDYQVMDLKRCYERENLYI